LPHSVHERPDVRARPEGLGILPFLRPTPEAFYDYIKPEIRKYAQVVKDSGVRPE
jgi:tripartite-type tricarboxylate transporter receptor subunit TctC